MLVPVLAVVICISMSVLVSVALSKVGVILHQT